MNILIIGAGAIGGYLGGKLAARHHVTIYDQAPVVDAVRSHGLRLIEPETEYTVDNLAAFTSLDEVFAHTPRFDLALCCVKAYSTAEVIEPLRPYADRINCWLTPQNGVANEDLLGLAFGRIGCFLNGCCWGNPICPGPDGPWYGVVYPPKAPAGDFFGVPTTILPTQVFESLLVVGICMALLMLRRRRKAYGEQILLLFIFYMPIRFLMECLRETPKSILGLSIAQVIGVLVFVPAVWGLVYLRKHGKPMAVVDAELAEREKKAFQGAKNHAENNNLSHRRKKKR
jgi:hypothetical protein